MEATTARLAIMSGAQFIVANMMSDEVAQICNLYQIPYAPGCTTMTEANHALSIGSAFIKCFPISNTYGTQLVGLFKTPTPWMPLMISGGINLDNLETWVRSGAECYGMGSLLTKAPPTRSPPTPPRSARSSTRPARACSSVSRCLSLTRHGFGVLHAPAAKTPFFVALCWREALLACQTPEFVADRRPTRDPRGT